MITILLTGAGGAAVPTLIAHLRQQGYRVVAVDADKHAVGLYLADKAYTIPRGDSPDWASAVQRIVEREQVDVVIPLVDEELPVAHDLKGVVVLAPRREFVETCLDKWRLYLALGSRGFRVPYSIKTCLWHDIWQSTNLAFPVVVKPRRGHGSKNVRVVQNQDQTYKAQDWLFPTYRVGNSLGDYIVQDYIDGPEYTVSVVCDGANYVHAVVPKEIICKRGITRLAVTRRHDGIDALCRKIATVLEPHGPFNVQLRLRDGEPYVFEINPRFSGTVNLTIQAGCDEVAGLCALALGQPWDWREWCDGVVLVRRYADVAIGEGDYLNQESLRGELP